MHAKRKRGTMMADLNQSNNQDLQNQSRSFEQNNVDTGNFTGETSVESASSLPTNMNDSVRNNSTQDLQHERRSFEEDYFGTGGYNEETAAEIAEPLTLRTKDSDREQTGAGTGLGLTALALSILSLFVFPVLLGIAGIVLGFVARRRGAASGSWAIGIGALSLILGLFILPFF